MKKIHGTGPLFVVGPPRSGTSITARVLQAHIGMPYPFEVNRHDEPVELVGATERLLDRNGMTFDDRMNPEGVAVDPEFVRDVSVFLRKYSDMRCVVKEPIFTQFFVSAPIFRRYDHVSVDREIVPRSRSFMRRKGMTEQQAMNASCMWHECMRTLFPEGVDIMFQKGEQSSFSWKMVPVLEHILDKEFKQSIVDEHWAAED